MPWKPQSYEARYRKAPARPHWTTRLRRRPGPDPRRTARWQALRAQVLQACPWCVDPFGVHALAGERVPATEVDHVLPVWDAPERAARRTVQKP